MVIFSSFIFCRIVFVAVGKRESRISQSLCIHGNKSLVPAALGLELFANAVMQITFVIRAYWLWLPSVFPFDSTEFRFAPCRLAHQMHTHIHTHRLMILEISGKIGNGLLYQTVNGKPIHNGNYVAELFHQFQTLYANITLHMKTNYYIYAYFLPDGTG